MLDEEMQIKLKCYELAVIEWCVGGFISNTSKDRIGATAAAYYKEITGEDMPVNVKNEEK